MCLFLCIHSSTPWQDVGISTLQASVYLPNTGRLASAAKEDSSQLTAVIKMGWLDKNPPQGYEWQQLINVLTEVLLKMESTYKYNIHRATNLQVKWTVKQTFADNAEVFLIKQYCYTNTSPVRLFVKYIKKE